jgi:hypothetical protein
LVLTKTCPFVCTLVAAITVPLLEIATTPMPLPDVESPNVLVSSVSAHDTPPFVDR